jgi:hypothetical protein
MERSKPRPCRRRGRLVGRALTAGLLLLAFGNFARADETQQPARPASEAATIKELQKQISERDALIRNLLYRVKRLERQERRTRALDQRLLRQWLGARTRPRTAADIQLDQTAPPAASHDNTAPPPAASSRPASPPEPQTAEAPPPAPQSAPGQFTVSAKAAQRALEQALVQTGALLLPPGQFQVVPSFSYQYFQFSRPNQLALSTSGTLFITQNELRTTLLQGGVLLRAGLPWDSQFEVGVPFGYKDLSITNQAAGSNLSEQGFHVAGNGDPTFTFTKQITKEHFWLPRLLISGTWEPNLGQINNKVSPPLALGAGFDELRASLLAVKRQDPLVFTAGFTYQTAFSYRHITPGDEYIPALGLLFAVSPQTSLQFSQSLAIIGKTRFNGAIVPGSWSTQGIFSIGLLSILGPGIVVNPSVAIGETPDAPNLTVQIAFPIQF